MTFALRRAALAMLLVLPGSALGQTPEVVPPAVTYKPGSGFKLIDGENFTLAISGRIQARYTMEDLDEDREKADLSSFTAERVRIGFKGSVFKDWEFEYQADFGKGKVELRDAALAWAKHPEAVVKGGTFKVGFDRQQLVSSGRQQFVDRSSASRALGLGRDTGIQVAGALAQKKFQYGVGVYDGEGQLGRNANDGHAWIARISINPNGDYGLAESDIKRTDYHLWYVDLAAADNDDLWTDADMDGDDDQAELTDVRSYVFGFGYRHAGWSLQGEWFKRSTEKEDGSSDIDADAWYAQSGFMLVRDKWELALRYSEVDLNTDVRHDLDSEWSLALNRFLRGVGHSLKIQGDISLIEDQKDATTSYDDLRIRVQGQIIF